jgi:hypothetical protein
MKLKDNKNEIELLMVAIISEYLNFDKPGAQEIPFQVKQLNH